VVVRFNLCAGSAFEPNKLSQINSSADEGSVVKTIQVQDISQYKVAWAPEGGGTTACAPKIHQRAGVSTPAEDTRQGTRLSANADSIWEDGQGGKGEGQGRDCTPTGDTHAESDAHTTASAGAAAAGAGASLQQGEPASYNQTLQDAAVGIVCGKMASIFVVLLQTIVRSAWFGVASSTLKDLEQERAEV
jgi:hypothetical protein